MTDMLPTWSPNGEEIAFARGLWEEQPRGTQLMTVAADGSAEPRQPPETSGGFTWIPSREDTSGTVGYVRAELVSAD